MVKFLSFIFISSLKLLFYLKKVVIAIYRPTHTTDFPGRPKYCCNPNRSWKSFIVYVKKDWRCLVTSSLAPYKVSVETPTDYCVLMGTSLGVLPPVLKETPGTDPFTSYSYSDGPPTLSLELRLSFGESSLRRNDSGNLVRISSPQKHFGTLIRPKVTHPTPPKLCVLDFERVGSMIEINSFDVLLLKRVCSQIN